MKRALALVGILWAALGAAHGADTRTPQPTIARAASGEQCVEPSADMRRNHMRYLKHQRDDTVHGGVRGARHSLKGCIDCHAGATSHSVAHAPGDFCVSCHQYAAVMIDCFECHSAKTREFASAPAPAKEARK